MTLAELHADLLRRQPWRASARCRGLDPALFVDGPEGPAKRICAACPVQADCRTWAESERLLVGVFGGQTFDNHGSLIPTRRQRNRTCEIDGCDRPHKCLGLCRTHYTAARRNGTLGQRECATEGCDRPIEAQQLCARCYQQAKRQDAASKL